MLDRDVTCDTDQSETIEYLTQVTAFHNRRHTDSAPEILVRIMGMGTETTSARGATEAIMGTTRFYWLCVSKCARKDKR